MSSLSARTGRHRQRYDGQFRLVAGCIPYKLVVEKDKYSNAEKDIIVLMISTPSREDLVFPKGGWEDDETLDQAACREALEEAGVTGVIGEQSLGVWEFQSKSSQKDENSHQGGCRGYLFPLEVTQELDQWPGQATYNRKWLTIKEAYKVCRYDWMKDALKFFEATMSLEGKEEGA
ncbi:hypothetical protein K2173_006892 [Erythroxylum novogranatense]|uniref:Nudix hydrolase domain-containing protein n=1 Tax=Erythroxylum novogranatense TaxID=1862640 RepID=A0AAV8SY13_9ROSI|nr:hypothetical protein K2173_006892 [Erythroxylum novogranatense]